VLYFSYKVKESEVNKMEFEFMNSIYVEDNDLNEMVELAKHYYAEFDQTLEESVEMACEEVSMGWDDADYYNYSHIAERLEAEVLRRVIEGEKGNGI
jgi:hypothetical protein